MNKLKGLNPENVFAFFEEICSIPHGSGNTTAIRDYCVEFANSRKLGFYTDDAENVVIFKKGSAGRENEAPVIIQGHTDMVCQKDETSNFDFLTDGLELIVDGDFIRANGTTLGGDDGIAVAMCLALLGSDEYSHPPLEIVFTTDEETGMNGAFALDTSVLEGKRMLNLDSEAEGTLWVSCAGGARVDIALECNSVSNDKTAYKINVSGLHGGHSGAEIHNGYENANKVMGRLLAELKDDVSFNIVKINGGSADNAITRDCECVITAETDVTDKVAEIGNEICDRIKNTDPNAIINVRKCENSDECFDKDTTDNIIALLNELPSGVVSMSKNIEGLVETSLNIGVLKTNGNKVDYCFSVRSSVDSEKEKLCKRLYAVAEKYPCNFISGSDYPAWEFKEDSEIRDKMSEIYYDMFGKEMTVTAIHAGLECGLFCGKIKGLDCVSFGPDMYDIHTPSERLSISSTRRVWEYLLKVLEKI